MDKLKKNFKNTHYDSADQSESERSPITRHIHNTFDSFKSMFDALTPDLGHTNERTDEHTDRKTNGQNSDNFHVVKCEIQSDSSSEYLSVLSVVPYDW